MVPACNGTNFSHASLRRQTDIQKVDEEEEGGLRGLTEVLLSYGERHFDGSKKGVWPGILLMCGQFERVGAAPHVFAFYPDHHLGRSCAMGEPGDRNRSRPPCDRACLPWTSTRTVSR